MKWNVDILTLNPKPSHRALSSSRQFMRHFSAYLEYAISRNGDEPRTWLDQLLLHFMRQSLLPLFCTLGVGNKLGQTSIGLTGGLSIQSKNCDNNVRALIMSASVSKGACIHPLALALRL